MSLPSNQTLAALSADVPWQEVEYKRRQFQRTLETLVADSPKPGLPLAELSEAVGSPVTTYYDSSQLDIGNTLLTEISGHPIVLGSYVAERYRSGHTILESLVPYNLNPSVNHTNISETEDC